jgi:hypothetical protein
MRERSNSFVSRAALPFVKKMGDTTQTVLENCPGMRIEAGEALFPYFRPIFQAGFLFRCQVGQSIEDLLFRQLSLKKKFVEERISTIFLDGQCVDDISLATLKNDSIVAFSSALPGLVGATLRRGGLYACLRNSITYRKEDMPVHSRQGTITIKLFNLLMDVMGPVFLRKGIIMGRPAIVSFFQARKESFWKEIKTVHLGGVSITPDKLMEESTYNNYDLVTLCIDTENQLNEKIGIPVTN